MKRSEQNLRKLSSDYFCTFEFNKPNYKQWLIYDFWEPSHFAALWLDIEPDSIALLKARIDDNSYPQEWYLVDAEDQRLAIPGTPEHEIILKYQDYLEKLHLLEKSIIFNNTNKQATPQKCIDWASKKEIPMPAELSKYIITKEAKPNTRGITNSFNKLQQAFAALCKDQYNFDNDRDAMAKIQGSMNRGGFSLDDTTIRKHFKEGLDKISRSR